MIYHLIEQMMNKLHIPRLNITVRRNNQKMIDTINDTQFSALSYNIVETAKRNSLNLFRYLEFF